MNDNPKCGPNETMVLVSCWGSSAMVTTLVVTIAMATLCLALQRISPDFMTVHLNLPYADLVTGHRLSLFTGVSKGAGLGAVFGTFLGMCTVSGNWPLACRKRVFGLVAKLALLLAAILLILTLCGGLSWLVIGRDALQKMLEPVLSMNCLERIRYQTSRPLRGLFCFTLYEGFYWVSIVYFAILGVQILRLRLRAAKSEAKEETEDLRELPADHADERR